MTEQRGRLVVISGPSGAGKSTVIARLMQRRQNLCFSVSATTRDPRPGEVDGKDYFYVTREAFDRMVETDALLEHAEYVGNYYGTPEGPVNEMLAQGKDVILEIEVQGALIVKEKRPDAILVFIAPPSFEVLESRLRGRGTEKDEVVAMRLEKARGECAHMDGYDYIVVNDLLDDSINNLASIIRAARCRSTNVDLRLV